MGSDPRRLDGLRADEKFAAVLVERATGARARAHDVGARQGAHDVDLHYPGGRTGALEVTTHAGSGVRQSAALLGQERITGPDPRRWSWTLDSRPPGAPSATTAGAEPVDSALAGLPSAVSELLTVPHVARRASKVAAVPRVDERHLFLGIGEGGLPETLYLPLTAPLCVLPTVDPDVPDGVSHLWLTTARSGAPLVGWDRVHGWRAHQVERTAFR